MIYWCDSSGRLNLEMSREDFESGYHSGDCENDVRALMALPHVASQVAEWSHDDMRSNLSEYGAWSDEELDDEDMCRVRTLWLACGDVTDGAFDEE